MHLARALLVLAASLAAGACGGSTSTAVIGGPSTVRCAIALSATEARVGAARETGSVTVSAERECTWSATSGAAWIVITAGSGQGDGQVEFVVTENPRPAERRGAVTVSGQQIDILQEAAPCTFRLGAAEGQVSASGGTLTVGISSFPGCRWQAASHEPWVAVEGSGERDGDGAVLLQVAPNPGAPRTGLVTVADQPYRVVQAGNCSYAISRPGSHFPATGGNTGVDVTTEPWCDWRAESQVPWIGTPGGGRTGSGTVSLTVAANGGPARSGTVVIAGHLHAIVQEAAPCTYVLNPDAARVPFSGGTFSVTVVTPSWCEWSAVSHDNWLRIADGAHGVGTGTVVYEVARRLLPFPRAGTLMIAGERFTVTQTVVAAVE